MYFWGYYVLTNGPMFQDKCLEKMVWKYPFYEMKQAILSICGWLGWFFLLKSKNNIKIDQNLPK